MARSCTAGRWRAIALGKWSESFLWCWWRCFLRQDLIFLVRRLTWWRCREWLLLLGCGQAKIFSSYYPPVPIFYFCSWWPNPRWLRNLSEDLATWVLLHCPKTLDMQQARHQSWYTVVCSWWTSSWGQYLYRLIDTACILMEVDNYTLTIITL